MRNPTPRPPTEVFMGHCSIETDHKRVMDSSQGCEKEGISRHWSGLSFSKVQNPCKKKKMVLFLILVLEAGLC
jgi:hypothetical protein